MPHIGICQTIASPEVLGECSRIVNRRANYHDRGAASLDLVSQRCTSIIYFPAEQAHDSLCVPLLFSSRCTMQIKKSLVCSLQDKISEIIGEGFDIAIRIAELKDSGLVARKLGDIQHVTVAASTYLKQYGMPNHPADLSAHKCLIYTYRSTPKQWVYFDTQGEEHSVSVTGSFESNNSLAIRECLLKGSGIALIPAFIVQEDIQAGRLDVILQDYSGFARNLYAVIPDRKHINSKARAFIDFLKEKG